VIPGLKIREQVLTRYREALQPRKASKEHWGGTAGSRFECGHLFSPSVLAAFRLISSIALIVYVYLLLKAYIYCLYVGNRKEKKILREKNKNNNKQFLPQQQQSTNTHS
jgi:hypothetical protein